MTEIGGKAFYQCRNLESVTIGRGVTCIGSYAFYLSGLTSALFKDKAGWYSSLSSGINVGNKTQAANSLKDSSMIQYSWYKEPMLKCTEYGISDSTGISSSNNNDYAINPGETIKMDIEIYNRGSNAIQGINVKISSDSQYVTIISDTADFGDLGSSNYKTYSGLKGSPIVNNFCPSYYPFVFTVSESCPVNTVIPITFTMTSYNNTWTSTIDLEIY